MEGCRMEGGRGLYGGAVSVIGNSSLAAQQTTFHSKGIGLVVRGGKVLLEQCAVSENGWSGVKVIGGSTLHASKCQVDNNGYTNIEVEGGARVSLDQCTSNGSKDGCGWRMYGQSSSLKVTDSQACSNAVNGALASQGASLTLIRCKNDHNRIGWKAVGSGSTLVAEYSTTNNEYGNAVEEISGRITLRGRCDLGGQEVQQR